MRELARTAAKSPSSSGTNSPIRAPGAVGTRASREQLYLVERVQPWSRNRNLLGPLLETFVFSELVKSAAWTKGRVSIFHYRDKDRIEVDFVLENAAGQVVGIEVKAAASVTQRDFVGLERVAAAACAAPSAPASARSAELRRRRPAGRFRDSDLS